MSRRARVSRLIKPPNCERCDLRSIVSDVTATELRRQRSACPCLSCCIHFNNSRLQRKIFRGSKQKCDIYYMARGMSRWCETGRRYSPKPNGLGFRASSSMAQLNDFGAMVHTCGLKHFWEQCSQYISHMGTTTLNFSHLPPKQIRNTSILANTCDYIKNICQSEKVQT